MTIIDISTELFSAPVYPGDPAPELQTLRDIHAGDACNLHGVTMCLHAATHLDAPLHFVDLGTAMEELDLSLFIGPCTVLACNAFDRDLTGADIEELVKPGTKKLLIKGLGKCCLTASAAYAVADAGVELIGIDAQSVGAQGEEAEVHKALGLAGIAVLEGLTLRHVQSGGDTLVALPLKIAGVEAAPCRAVLLK